MDDESSILTSIARTVASSLGNYQTSSTRAGLLNAWVLLSEASASATDVSNLLRVESLGGLARAAAWESLHSASHWDTAPAVARDLLGCAAALLSACALARGDARGALRGIDSALLLMPPSAAVEGGLLQSLVKRAHEALRGGTTTTAPTTTLLLPIIDAAAVEPVALTAETQICTGTALKPTRRCASSLTMSDFLDIFSQNVPILVSGAVDHWPALAPPRDGARDRRWSNLNYLAEMLEGRGAPIEEGGHYGSPGWQETWENDLSDFVIKTVCGLGPGIVSGAATPTVSPPRYLAQARLFDLVPEMRNDAPVPDGVTVAAGEGPVRALAWLGPAGTFSPAHTDAPHNFFVQVVGVKRVRLFAPNAASSAAIPRADPPLNANTSSLPAAALSAQVPASPAVIAAAQLLLAAWKEDAGANSTPPDDAWAASYPAYARRDAEPWDVVLRPGDALFIPSGWWHSMTALTPSFSVSFWWEKGEPEREEGREKVACI